MMLHQSSNWSVQVPHTGGIELGLGPALSNGTGLELGLERRPASKALGQGHGLILGWVVNTPGIVSLEPSDHVGCSKGEHEFGLRGQACRAVLFGLGLGLGLGLGVGIGLGLGGV